MTELKTYPDVTSYLSGTENFLMKHEVVNNLILGICNSLKEDPEKSKNFHFLSVVHKDGVMATCICSHGSIVLAAATYHTGDLKLLIDYFKEKNLMANTVFGETLYVEIFSEMLKSPGAENRYRLLSVEKLFKYKTVKADFMTATTGQQDILAEYLFDYEKEINAHKKRSVEQISVVTADLIKNKKLFALMVGNDVVCMAAFLRSTKNYGVIANVYTPKQFRNRGYAGFCVAKLSETILEQGFKGCALFTDMQNQTANQMYAELGYLPVAEFKEISFEAS